MATVPFLGKSLTILFEVVGITKSHVDEVYEADQSKLLSISVISWKANPPRTGTANENFHSHISIYLDERTQ